MSDRSSWEVTRPLWTSCIAFIIVNTLVVLAKTYSRVQLARLRFWWDDFWIIVAYVLLLPICIIGLVMVKVETSWSSEDRLILNLDENEILLKLIYSLLQFLLASYAATRYSILALYLRIFSDRTLRIAIWTVIAFVTLQWLGFAITALAQCSPVQYYWNRRIEGTCVDIDKFYRAVTPFNIVVDLIVIFIPLPPVWKLKATNTRKWALSILFGIGVSALIASAIRLTVYDTHTATVIAPSYTNIMIMWLVIEPSIYLIAACLPAMHHVIVAVIPSSIRKWMSSKMARLGSTVLGRSNKGGVTLNSECRDGSRGTNDDEIRLNLELGTAPGRPPAKSSAQAERGETSSVDWGTMNKGIMVTKEVTVTYTEEERIQRVIGF